MCVCVTEKDRWRRREKTGLGDLYVYRIPSLLVALSGGLLGILLSLPRDRHSFVFPASGGSSPVSFGGEILFAIGRTWSLLPFD